MQLYHRDLSSNARDDTFTSESSGADYIDLEALMAIARRQWRLVAAGAIFAALLGFGYVLTAVPLYTSSVSVLIDRGNNEVVQRLSTISSDFDDEGTVLSQVELLKSDTIASTVVDKLKLADDVEFMASEGSMLATIKRAIRSILNVSQWFAADESPQNDEQRRVNAAAILLGNIEVERVGRTYVLEISYTSPSPGLSAKLANAIGEAYLVDKLSSKYDATRRASDWLQERIAELRQKALHSDLAVQKFRSANGLVSAGNLLVSDQQLSELNSALIVAQSDTAKARARLAQIKQIMASGQTDAIVKDVLDSSISNDLRKKYLDASKLEAEISNRLGQNHIQAQRLRTEMGEYKRLMYEELDRISKSYESDVEVAEAREKSLTDSVSQATTISATANETQVQLRELEREAETYRNLYQTFLQRFQEAVQQQSFPVTDARIITRATPSTAPSYPKRSITLAIFAVFGGMLGASAGAFREFRDRFFRTGEQVREVLGLEYLGITPIVSAASVMPPSDTSDPRSIRKTTAATNQVIDHPLSAFAETMRSTKIAADLSLVGKDCKVIGVVSALPGEGKSTVSINLAELLASQGARTILIDCDLRNPGATRALANHAVDGLVETLMAGRNPGELLLRNPKTGMVFLPAVIKHRIPHSSELLSSVAMRNMLADLSKVSNYIVLDLPPLGPVVDARAIAGRVDGFVFVTEWGKTARRAVKQILDAEPLIREKCLGVILNKVDQERMKLYRSFGSTDYYYESYSRYYQEKP